jgi:PIN domain nuclease of toxin-antitoxin system
VIVLDAAAILAALLREPGAEAVLDLDGGFAVSTLNLGEVAARLSVLGHPLLAQDIALAPFTIAAVPVSSAQALQAGRWLPLTRPHGLSLADRVCLALALELKAEVWTTDRALAAVELGVRVRLIR